jgi:5-formyltetrahydrofolate cyclo-ligase
MGENGRGGPARSIAAEKKALRAAMLARRRVAYSAAAAEAAAGRFLAAVPLPGGAVVSAYWPMGEELDPRPLMRALHAAGHGVCLPAVVERGAPLVFRAWTPETALLPNVFGTSAPPPAAPVVRPDALLVPLLAFDAQGWRLGYGGGYYDRTLRGLRSAGRTLAIGFGYAAQEVEALPREPFDEPLDWIVTECEARAFR